MERRTVLARLRHVPAWEAFAAERLGQLTAGVASPLPAIDASWNERYVAAQRGEPWTAAWVEFLEARAALLAALDLLSEDDLARPLPSATDPERRAYAWLVICIEHERAHAAGVRAGLGLPPGILAG